jgi:hypothetical protein
MEAKKLAIRCFPHDDVGFETDVQEALASSWETIRTAERLLADVRAKLRTDYPKVRLTTQARLAADPLGPDVIYAYRDGRVA